MDTDRVVYVVDDEAPLRRSLGLMLRTAGWQPTVFDSGLSFVEAAADLPDGCVLLDMRMPAMDGLQVQEELSRRGIDWPVTIMTGHGDIIIAVAALRAGAIAFIEKPFEKARVLDALERGLLKLRNPERFAAVRQEAEAKLASLTERELGVLKLLSDGIPNRGVAEATGLALAQVEVCRASVIEKTGGSSLADAVTLAFLAEAVGNRG